MGLNTNYPNTSWALNDWIAAAGDAKQYRIIQDASEFDGDFNISRTTLSHWNKNGIPRRKDAIALIAALRRIARSNRKPLFNNKNIRQQGRIFLRSKACKEKFASLDIDEIEQICGGAHIDVPEDEDEALTDLRARVQPSPPVHRRLLFGREHDIQRILTGLEEKPIVIIDGVAGDGKTTLAWFAALEAVRSELCLALDWLTDKRYIVTLTGERFNLRNKPLDHGAILRSLVHRFQWDDLIGIQDLHSLQKRCASKLRAGRYLVVFDNLETSEDADEIVRFFGDMLSTKGSRATLSSRFLITSREKVDNSQCARVDIQGIEEDQRVEYLRSLENPGQMLLSDAQRTMLADLTDGNPLFMQIAFYLYTTNPCADMFDLVVASLEKQIRTYFDQAFENLFGDLMHRLGPDALWLARQAAFNSLEDTIRDSELQQHWQVYCHQDLGHSPESCSKSYAESIYSLVKNRILNPIPHTGKYHMHSLICAYLLRNLHYE